MTGLRKSAAFVIAAVLPWGAGSAIAEPAVSAPPRIVTLGAAVTETVVELGSADRIVAFDSTSTGILSSTQAKDLGFYKRISAVGVLSVRPTLVLATHDAGFAATFDQLRQARVRVVRLPTVASADGAIVQIELIAKAIGRVDAGEKLIAEIRGKLAALAKERTKGAAKRRMLFIYARGAGAMLVGGRQTTAHAMIELVGGANVAAAFEGYKPFSPEALVAQQPEVLLMTTHGFEALGGMSGLQSHVILSKTPAVMLKNVIVRPAKDLLSFGPQFARRARELCTTLAALPPSTRKVIQ